MSKKSRDKRSLRASLAYINRLFQLVLERQFTEAERTLERLKERMEKNEWNSGYLQALNGMILTQRSGDERYAFLTNLDPNDEEALKKHRRDFLKHVKSGFHADYDRGFFSAWADFLWTTLGTRKKAKLAGDAK